MADQFHPFIEDAEVKMAPTRWRDRLQDFLLPLLGKQQAQQIAGIGEMLPGLGGVSGVEDVALGLKDEDYLQAGLGAAGFLPFGGALKKLYHGTLADYTRPYIGLKNRHPREIGYHVGSKEAAEHRIPNQYDPVTHSVSWGEMAEGANIRPVTLNVNNSYSLDEDLGVFTPTEILTQLKKQETIGLGNPQAELHMKNHKSRSMLLDDLIALETKWRNNKKYKPYFDYENKVTGQTGPTAEATEEMTEAMKKVKVRMALDLDRVMKRNKFDAIKYPNHIEGEGEDSYMILNPKDILEEKLK